MFCHLTAERHPEFLKRPEGTTVPLGYDAKFEVVVDGEPRPTVKWYISLFHITSISLTAFFGDFLRYVVF